MFKKIEAKFKSNPLNSNNIIFSIKLLLKDLIHN